MFQPDVFLGLLEQLQADNASDEPGTPGGPFIQQPDTEHTAVPADVVGPTAEELESFNELMKFDHGDHVYHKATPAGLTTSRATSAQSAAAGETAVRATDEQGSNQPTIVLQIPDVDLSQEAFDRLFDLDSILEADLKQNEASALTPVSSTTAPVVDCVSVSKDSLSVPTVTGLKSRKRKMSDSKPSEAVCFGLSPRHQRLASDDIPSFDEMSLSPEYSYSSDLSDALSPRSDASSPLADSGWEDSFTELFPSLV